MAEIKSSPSAAKVDEGAKKDVQTRPVKPDEAAFKAKLAQAEKDHKQSQEKAVSKKIYIVSVGASACCIALFIPKYLT